MTRAEVFGADEVAIVHVMNRTVRRCYLMGDDPVSGKNYDYRKALLESELRRLAASFGIDLLCYAIMSNHFHLVLRSRPDVVATWDDTEVARRWLTLCPPRKDKDQKPVEPTEFDLNMIRKNKLKLAAIRSRLSDISWWMRLLSQKVAQKANKDDEEVGKFWQSRYRAVRLLDETAVLACAAYVDLNPIRAAMAKTVESSDYTSAQKRVEAIKQVIDAKSTSGSKQGPSGKTSKKKSASGLADPIRPDGHLSPLEINERRDAVGPHCHRDGLRASDKGFLPMTVAGYVELLDWTARQVRGGKRGSTPASAKLIFERLGISGEVWTELVKEFGRLFITVAGKPHEIDTRRSRKRHRRFKTHPRIRKLLAG
jgi:hypothetical protein